LTDIASKWKQDELLQRQEEEQQNKTQTKTQTKTQINSQVRQLSAKFLVAFKTGDYETVVSLLEQTNRLVVPVDFDLFSSYALSSKRDKITGLLLDKVQSGQLQLINSASHL